MQSSQVKDYIGQLSLHLMARGNEINAETFGITDLEFVDGATLVTHVPILAVLKHISGMGTDCNIHINAHGTQLASIGLDNLIAGTPTGSTALNHGFETIINNDTKFMKVDVTSESSTPFTFDILIYGIKIQ